jgi:hypothetical protein
MKAKFDYDDVVRIAPDAPDDLRPNGKAWIVGVFETRPGPFFDTFPDGVVYSIEFEDGSSKEIHEMYLRHDTAPP